MLSIGIVTVIWSAAAAVIWRWHPLYVFVIFGLFQFAVYCLGRCVFMAVDGRTGASIIYGVLVPICSVSAYGTMLLWRHHGQVIRAAGRQTRWAWPAGRQAGS